MFQMLLPLQLPYVKQIMKCKMEEKQQKIEREYRDSSQSAKVQLPAVQNG